MTDTSSGPPECSICYDPIKLRGELDSCRHLFCFPCIYHWSETANTCPMCKLRFSSITKRDLTAAPSPAPAAAGSGSRKRKGQSTTPRPEKVRVRRRDARFFDNPDDYLPQHRDELFRRHEPHFGPAFLPFFGGRLSSLRELLGLSSPRADSPPSPPDYHHHHHLSDYRAAGGRRITRVSPPPPLPLHRNVRPLPIPAAAAAAAAPVPVPPAAAAGGGSPVLIDLTRDDEVAAPPRAPSQPVVIDLTGDSAVEIVDDAEPKGLSSSTRAGAPSRDRDQRERDRYPFSPFRISITGGAPQIGIFNLSVPNPSNEQWERQSSSISFEEW